MELDELKDLWKKSDAAFRPRNEDEIASMLRGSSRSIVAKLKKTVWFELVLTLVAGVILLGFAMALPSGALKWITTAILVMFVAYCVYYVKKLRVLAKFNPGDDNLRANLQHLVDSLTTYLRFYKRSYTVLFPVYFALGLLFGGIERGLEEFLVHLAQPKTIVFLLLLTGVFYICSVWVVNWMMKKLYGNRLEKLRGLLRELDNADDTSPGGQPS